MVCSRFEKLSAWEPAQMHPWYKYVVNCPLIVSAIVRTYHAFLQLNDDYYECLTPATTIALLEACKAGQPPKMGKWGSLPMNGQVILRMECAQLYIFIHLISASLSCRFLFGCVNFRWAVKVHWEKPHFSRPLLRQDNSCERTFPHQRLMSTILPSFTTIYPVFLLWLIQDWSNWSEENNGLLSSVLALIDRHYLVPIGWQLVLIWIEDVWGRN